MKRIILLAVCALWTIALMLVLNCSNPLETTDSAELDPPGPITIVDTVTIVDTLIIYEPGDGEPQTVCSILLANLYEIIWMFHNAEGDYTLKFTADAVRDFDFRTLTVDIDGEQYTWCPVDDREVVYEQHLSAFANIRIMTDQPCLQGHEVDICLTIAQPE